MDIQKLRALATLAAAKNYTETAERLFTTQSNISKQISSLESELKVQLVDRSHRKANLTPAGETALRHAQTILHEYDSMLQELHQSCCLRVACLPVMAHYGLTGLISAFQSRYPGISLQLEELEGQDLLQLLAQGQAQLAICRADHISTAKFECLPLCRDRLAAAVPAQHPLAGSKAVSLRQLQDESMLQLGESSTLYQLILNACVEAGFAPKICYTSRRMENILAMVSDGAGVSLMMEHAAKYLPAKGAVILPLKEEIFSQLALVRMRGAPHTPDAEKFWAFARSWKQQEQNQQ